MSVEGLWALAIGEWNSGVVVLETGKVLGGDNEFAYVGSYSVKDTTITIDAELFAHKETPEMDGTIFGTDIHERIQLRGTGDIVDQTISGTIWLDGNPDSAQTIVLSFIAHVP